MFHFSEEGLMNSLCIVRFVDVLLLSKKALLILPFSEEGLKVFQSSRSAFTIYSKSFNLFCWHSNLEIYLFYRVSKKNLSFFLFREKFYNFNDSWLSKNKVIFNVVIWKIIWDNLYMKSNQYYGTFEIKQNSRAEIWNGDILLRKKDTGCPIVGRKN